MEQEFSCFLEPHGYSGKLQSLTPVPTPLLLAGAGGSAQGRAVSASKHFHLKNLQRRIGWTGKIRMLLQWCADIPDKIQLWQGALTGSLLSSCFAEFMETL